jgi:hypothetical protein
MNLRPLAVIAAALAVGVAACGGGGGSASPGPQPQPSPVGSSRPAGNGDVFHYGGTLTQTFWRPAQPGPSNAPSPEPTSTANWSVDNVATVKANSTFHGRTGLTDFNYSETDTGLQTIVTLTDDYLSFPPTGNGPLNDVGFSSIDSNFVSLDVQLGAGNGQIDTLPETAGAQWANSAAQISTETDPDGQTITRTTNADGSYTEADAFPDGTTATAVQNSDTSGTYKVLQGSSLETDYTYTAPSGGSLSITVTEPQVSPAPSPVVFTVPDWLPAGGLASDSFSDAGPATIPAACGVPKSIGTSGMHIAETRSLVDAIFGTVDAAMVDTYVVQGRGVACVVSHDVVTAYYDYTGQNGFAFFSGLPVQYTTLDEMQGLKTESLSAIAKMRPAVLVRGGAAWLRIRMRLRAARGYRDLSHGWSLRKGVPKPVSRRNAALTLVRPI